MIDGIKRTSSSSEHLLVCLNPAPASLHSSASLFECHTQISKSNQQQLIDRSKSPSYIFSFPIICFTWMDVTIQNKRLVGCSTSSRLKQGFLLPSALFISQECKQQAVLVLSFMIKCLQILLSHKSKETLPSFYVCY